MGCDTHMYIEYRNRTTTRGWSHFGGRINPGRNYDIFGIISEGVRVDKAFNFPQKGMPEDAAYESRNANQLFISDDISEETTTMERAKKWVDSGISKFINNHEGRPTWVTNPDWHSHSWLSTQEFEQAMKFYNEDQEGAAHYEPEYEALLAAMQKFEQLGYECRVVFWFDN